jgi:hypothetical protein
MAKRMIAPEIEDLIEIASRPLLPWARRPFQIAVRAELATVTVTPATVRMVCARLQRHFLGAAPVPSADDLMP